MKGQLTFFLEGRCALIVITMLLIGHNLFAANNVTNRGPLSFNFELRNDCTNWNAGFADFPVESSASYELMWKCAPISELTNAVGLYITGINHSDDLFMFIKRPLTGLAPNSEYEFKGTVTFWSNAPKGCAGAGGKPGESVYLKFGVVDREPEPMRVDGFFRMNVDVGRQANGSKSVKVLGDVATSNTDCHNWRFEQKTLQTRKETIRAKTDAYGRCWLLIGTDSGFEAKSTVIYTAARIDAVPVSQP
jgi:hypothetical protein